MRNWKCMDLVVHHLKQIYLAGRLNLFSHKQSKQEEYNSSAHCSAQQNGKSKKSSNQHTFLTPPPPPLSMPQSPPATHVVEILILYLYYQHTWHWCDVVHINYGSCWCFPPDQTLAPVVSVWFQLSSHGQCEQEAETATDVPVAKTHHNREWDNYISHSHLSGLSLWYVQQRFESDIKAYVT